MRKIGIFGGTFNPIHNGHLHMLEILRDRLPLDEIWVMPANIPPHKEAKELASGKDRLKMAALAVEDLEDVAVCDLELRSPGKSYTYDTLLHLKKAFPEDSFTLIMGSDMFLSFEKWYRHQEILSMCGIVCAARHDGEYEALMKKAKRFPKGNIHVILAPPLPLSSTEVRYRLHQGEDISGLVPLKVAEYIRKRRLYNGEQEKVLYDFPYFEKLLREKLSEKRLYHSFCVRDRAVFLANRYGVDEEKAKAAGILHDIAKDTPSETLLKFFKDSGIILKNEDLLAKPIWHSIAGAAYAQNVLFIDETDVINAIRYHTTGRAGMSRLEKVIFLADLTSKDRDYPDVETVRRLSEESLDDALLYCIRFLISDMMEKGNLLHSDTVSCYNELTKAGVGRK